ncbi:MAG: hypothetical protein JXQ73_31480 [Phycisphaerae bacterium]|nr:hypothetical protein [Phycisphaerae bacterium]
MTVWDQQRWPPITALLTSWLMPARTAERTNHVSLRSAYSIHWLAALLTVAAITVLVAWEEQLYLGTERDFMGQVARVIEDVLREFVRQPFMAMAVTVGIILWVEATFLGLAFLATPWGARDESMRASFKHALRRTWMQTPHVVVAVLLAGTCVVQIDTATSLWRREPVMRAVPQPSGPRSVNPEAWIRYDKELESAQEEFRHQFELRRQVRPWYVRYGEEMIAIACIAASVWFLVALARAVGAWRSVPPSDRPPTCESCGYNLIATAADARCPECGTPVAESLGPDVRPGLPWQSRRWGTYHVLWRNTALGTIRRPRQLGQRIQRFADPRHFRVFFLLHLPVVFVIAWAGILGCYAAQTGRNPFVREPEVAWALAPAVGGFAIAIDLMLVMCTTWLLSLSHRLQGIRNLMPLAMQVAAYMCGYLVLFFGFVATLGVLAFALKDLWKEIGRTSNLGAASVGFLFWLIPTVIGIVGYVSLVRRGVSTARYANR